MTVFLGADHKGYDVKLRYKSYLESHNFDVVDVSQAPLNPDDDYPVIASKLVREILNVEKSDQRGILICGSGQGMVIAANRFKGIRACLCWNEAEALSSRNDDDSNILCLSTDYIEFEEATKIINIWLNTDFAAAPRFIRRIKELDQLG